MEPLKTQKQPEEQKQAQVATSFSTVSLGIQSFSVNMGRFSILIIVASCWASLSCNAFVNSPPTAFVRSNTFTVGKALWATGKDKDSGGGAALAKPAVKIGQKTALVTETKQKVETKRKNKTSDPISRREEEFQEAPMFKLMLLQDDGYDPGHVVERLCAIVDDMDEDQAATVFQQAQQEGKAMCGKYPFERAELFKEQLLRSDPMIFADLEEENKRPDEKKTRK